MDATNDAREYVGLLFDVFDFHAFASCIHNPCFVVCCVEEEGEAYALWYMAYWDLFHPMDRFICLDCVWITSFICMELENPVAIKELRITLM